MFEKDRGVVMVGWLHEGEEDLPESSFTRPRDEWFYIHADKISREKEDRYEEKIPIKDYFFRYDIGAFWTVKGVFDKLNIPFNRFTRTLLHPFTDTSTIYNLIDAGNYSGEFVSQDIITKKENTEELMEWAFENVEMSAMWLLPTTTDEMRELSPSNVESSLGINVGIWCTPKNVNPLEVKKALEQKQIQLGARKTLYAHQFYTEEEFWEIYDREKYQELRKNMGLKRPSPASTKKHI